MADDFSSVSEKKSPWSKPLVVGIALMIVAVLVVAIYVPGIFNPSPKDSSKNPLVNSNNQGFHVSGISTSNTPKKGVFLSFTPTVSGGTTPYTYSWTITDDDTATVEATYSIEKPTHTFLSTDFYIVKVTVADSAGKSATFSINVNPAPNIS